MTFAPVTANSVVITRRHTYRLAGRVASGDLAALHAASYAAEGGRTATALIKIPYNPRDSRLMDQEARALTRLAEHGDPRFLPYVPRLVDSFRSMDAVTGQVRQCNVLGTPAGLRSLDQLHAAHPQGVDPVTAAGIWRQLLAALGFAHRAGVIHGAVLPAHVLVDPAAGTVVLVDWCYSVTTPGTPVRATVPDCAWFYPPEVALGRPADPSTDIYLAARTMLALIGSAAPRRLRTFAAGCTLARQDRRPADAWALLAELDPILMRLFGPSAGGGAHSHPGHPIAS